MFRIVPTKEFLEQAKQLDEKTKRIVDEKLDLLKENPYRFKSLYHKNLKLFRIRLNVQNKETRLVYAVIKPDVILLCFIERKKDYRDLAKYLKNFKE
jgi:mRNA-degrading endonuclease RelE of RelBE toxin-antitoxin system